MIHQNKFWVFQRFKLCNITTEVLKENMDFYKYSPSRENLSKYGINAKAAKKRIEDITITYKSSSTADRSLAGEAHAGQEGGSGARTPG